jgi:hypothetical protein
VAVFWSAWDNIEDKKIKQNGWFCLIFLRLSDILNLCYTKAPKKVKKKEKNYEEHEKVRAVIAIDDASGSSVCTSGAGGFDQTGRY